METFIYKPEGVCSREMHITHENGVVIKAEVIGGCHGNLQGICRLIEGMKIEDIIPKIQGIRCGYKPTSCPDQLAKCLSKIK